MNCNAENLMNVSGFMVILPDYYRGEAVKAIDDTLMDFIKKHTVWENLKADADKVIAFAKAKGAKVFGSVGEHIAQPAAFLPDNAVFIL